MDIQYIQTSQYEDAARSIVEAAAWCYVESGSGSEQTIRANRAAFDHLWLRPRVLVPMDVPDLSTTVLGTEISLPVMAAPIGFQQLVHLEGEVASVKGTGQAQTLYVASSSATTSLEQIAAAASVLSGFSCIYLSRVPCLNSLFSVRKRQGIRPLWSQ